MRKLIKLLVLVLVTNCVFATDYYISNTGNDANNGTSAATAWATISKLNSSWASIVSGDRVLFQSGGTFYGSINVTKSGVTLGAYGTGAKPIITGFITPTSWSNTGTNLWATSISTTLNNIRLLTLNGQIVRNGRFPNYVDGFAAWIRYTNQLGAVTPVNVTSATAISPSYVGGELVLFKNNWNLDVMPINSISGTTINCTNPAGMYGIAANPYIGGWGYFVQNNLATLDQQNEWHFSNSTKLLTMFSTSNPSTLGTIKFPTLTTLITLGGNTNITIDGLDVQGCTEKAITGSGSNVTIRNCYVRFAQGWGIDLRGSNALIENNLVRDIGSNGIWVTNSATIRGNTVETCGNIEGLAGLTNSGAGTQGNQDNQHTGIEIETGSSSAVTCSQNIIDSIGYAGIRFYGSNITLEKNVISFPCIAKSDGGGIYAWDQDGTITFTNRRVKNNIILNSGKFLYGTGTPGLNTNSYGIYFDGGVRNVLCDSNVIGPNFYSQNGDCTTPYNTIPSNSTTTNDDAAIMLNFAVNTTLRRNIVFGWPDAIEMWRYPGRSEPIGNRFVDNALYVNQAAIPSSSCTWNQSFQYHSLDNATSANLQTYIQNMGVMDSNYVSDFSTSPFLYKSQSFFGPATKLAAWRTFSGKDINSTTFPSTTPDFRYNATSTPFTYSFPGLSKIDFRGVVYNNSVVIPPYYGNIFFPNGNATGGTPLSATSTATSIACNGGNSTVTVAATGGTAPYTGTGTFTRTAGTYTFTVTDAAGGSATTSITIAQPTALVAANPTAPAITSVGGTTTISQPAPTGGTAPFTYQLGTGVIQATNTWSGIAAGSYSITIKDANGCTLVKVITIAPFVAPSIIVAAVLTSPIACNGGLATITVTATGGTPPYTGTGTFTRTAGTWSFTVTDAAGATATSSITITQPPVLTVTATATPITCVGGNSTVVISATGGTPPYTGTGTFTRTAGTHTFVVVDANGCSITTTVTVNDPQVITPTVTIGSVVSPGSVLRVDPPVIITSLPTATSDMSVVIFPNPTTGRFNLELKTTSRKTVSIFVYSLEGRIVFQTSGAPKDRYVFGNSLIAGMYTVKVIQGEDVRVIKVTKGE